MLTGEAAVFYENHRGGHGAVVLAIAIDTATHAERHGIFGSIELAQSWSDSLGDGYVCVFSPYIVDDPDWGNEALAR